VNLATARSLLAAIARADEASYAGAQLLGLAPVANSSGKKIEIENALPACQVRPRRAFLSMNA
jgi:hypothetical protein